MKNFKDLQAQYEFDVYPKRDIVLTHGKNSTVWDDRGNEYIDCIAGHGVANIGHCNPAVIAAIEAQAKKLITCPGTFYNDVRAQLMEKLVSISPESVNKVFLCNSGAESIEAAIKFARFSQQKHKIICANRGFHGRTLGALSATFQPAYKKDFEPLVPGFEFVPFNRFEKMLNAIDEETAAIMLELVQGEGGVHSGSNDFFQNVQALCRERDILLIIDEVQTGFCRTGKMFACEHFNLLPDILCVAKGIAGGLPMGAVLCSDKVQPPTGRHGSTFGGNPLACAAAIAAIDFMLEHDLALMSSEKGAHLRSRLESHDISRIREIRQMGLMIGIELKEKVKPHLMTLMKNGVLALPAGATVLRLLPPLTISYEELDTVADKIIAGLYGVGLYQK
ncbi:acetylornithine/succinylornithine family transaminase [candidate division KSB1 bacterium]|nr:acetylornithine/succinylornithine family transaminase [candidate division KSB1 bacterium]